MKAPGPIPQLPTALPLRVIAIVVAAHVSFGGLRLALSLVGLQQGISTFGVGVILGLLMVVPVFSSLAVGRWADRAGSARPMRAGTLLLFAGAMTGAILEGGVALGCAAVLIGTGLSTVQVAGMNAVGHAVAPTHTVRAFAALALGFSISAFIGPVAAGALLDAVGARATFAVLGVPVLCGWCMALLSRPHGMRRAEPDAAGDESAAGGGRLPLWREPALRVVLVCTGLLTLSWDLYLFMVPLHGHHLGLSATAIGALAGCFAGGSIAVRLVLSPLSARVGENRLLWTALAGSTICFALYPLSSSFYVLAGIGIVLGVLLGAGQPMAMALIHRRAPPGRSGEAMGLRSTLVSGGQSTLPMLFGAAGSALGTGSVFWAVAVLVVAGMVWLRRIER